MDVIKGLYDGTANPADVYRALGWEIRPHGAWSGRQGKYAPGEGMSGLANVTDSARDALYLIDHEYTEAAVRAAMMLNQEFTGRRCPIARRICVIALMQPEFQSEFARPRCSMDH